ncbi:MAG TPA: YjjI family glycine radical enzyme [Feifaniaceae bacterium]|nr:YjjI family glycine radical enzyme [Feifaniaceae bacterium]
MPLFFPPSENALRIIKDTSLTHEQAMMNLSRLPAQAFSAFPIPEGYERLTELGVISDLGEGYAPYCPRYLLPDYAKLMQEGCKFLRIEPPKDLFEAIEALKMFYRHVPSVTNFPVYLGRLDRLLDPFIENEDEARRLIRHFLIFMDRTISDSYAHANIGPEETRAGNILLDCGYELQNAVPAMTLLYDPDITPDAFADKCIRNALAYANPSFADHRTYQNEYPAEYGIASCYNLLPVGGGAYTLCRLNLHQAAKQAKDEEAFLSRVLPDAVSAINAFMDAKIKFLVEESLFFRSNFMVQEGFLKRELFTGMFGMVGLAECVNTLCEKAGKAFRFGHCKEADALGVAVMERLTALIEAHHCPYCEVSSGHYSLHAQVGIDSDIGTSPGARIPIGEEIPLYEHLRHAGMFHPYFRSGTGDIFPFEVTLKNNPDSLLDIIRGAFSVGMRYFSTYASDADVIRITGYLVKRSDMEKLARGEAVQQHNALWGLGEVKNGKILERKVRTL